MYAVKLGNDYDGSTIFATVKNTQTTDLTQAFTTPHREYAARKARWVEATINRDAEVVKIV